MKEIKKKRGLSRLMELSSERKGLLIFSCATGIVHVLLSMVPYVLIFYILNELLEGKAFNPAIYSWITWAFVAVVVTTVLIYISAMAAHIAAFDILYSLRCKIADTLGKLPMGYLKMHSSGALKKIVADDVERVEIFIAHSLSDVVKAITLPLCILGYLFTVDWRLALVSLLPLVLVCIVVPLIMRSKAGKDSVEAYHISMEKMNSSIVEFVRAMPVMKIFGQSASTFAKYHDTVEDFTQNMKIWTNLTSPPWAMAFSFLNNALLPLLIVGLYLYYNGQLTLPVFFLFLILGVGYIRPAFTLTGVSFDIMMIGRSVERMDDIVFAPQPQQSGTEPMPENFSLQFHNTHFSYVAGVEVINDVSFTVPQGSITALVGPSGSGKSTIGQLVARFYDLENGYISLGNVDIRNLPLEELMKNVGYVFQDNFMFNQSIYENIRMGMDKTKQEVIAAAKVACCHEFIMSLPQEYDTVLGSAGGYLSGGEQQRVQLARVVLKNPSVLILDEATAFSDPENERLIMTAINDLIQNKTVLIIAHRLSTIMEADQIVVLDGGKVDAIGRHEELLLNSPLYCKMWEAHTRAGTFELQGTSQETSTKQEVSA